MIRFGTLFCAAVTACLLTAAMAQAALQAHGLFTENAVLQRGHKVPVWGTTDKTEKVTVGFAGQEASAEPKDGNWRVELQPLEAGGPHTLTITQGDAKLEFKNILVGDVWVCGGQSNMEWPLTATAGSQEAIAASANDKIRLFTVPRRGNGTPETNVASNWAVCGPQSVAGFSAVGYYFGRDLEKTQHVPIGLISSNVGGTTAERWMSRESLEANPELVHLLKPRDQGGAEQGTCDLWNAMIAPIIQFPIKGAIWYQGESNAGRAFQYRTLLPAMINCWRKAWAVGDFPFLIVQLAPFMQITPEPGESNWAELRDAQLYTSQSLPHVGLAVITDVGDEKDIHPQRKREVGERLALAARAIGHDEKITYSGPLYDRLTISGDKAILNFKHVGGGLTAKGADLQGFTVAGEDKKFYNANARIEGDTVIVWSDKVPQPKAIRYGWANYPLGNLWNQDGLPATPFRTDDFPYTTVNNK